MKIYRPDGKLWREVVALDSSFCEETLERFNRISLDFVLAEEVLVPELCYVTWRGERYSLFSTPKVVKVSTREYRYTLNLEGRHLELDRVLVKDKLGRTKFVFTGRTDQYADLISDCLPSWKVGACTTGDATRVIAFNNTSLLEACRMVASKFETEVQLTDGAISFGRVERYKSDPLLLAYRNGLKKDITVEPDPKETAIGRLYVVGADRNIDPAKYGSHQLHLPKGGKVSVGGRTFVADAEGRYISLEGDTRLNTSERAFDASSVYPKRVGTVSKVEQMGDEWDVLDDANTIDYGQHRVGGDTMRLEFQSGRLAGRTFDLATKEDKLVGYVHSEKRFKLVRKEIDGVLMPEPTTFYPAVGDMYAIFGCSLPDEYITSAEGEMLLRGAEYMAERLEPRLQYRAELDGLWAKKNWGTVAHKLVVGTIVRLEGASSEVRISSVRTSLNSPYTPRITFSNAPYMVGSLATQIATLENAEVRQREELRAGLVKLQDRTYKDTEAVREMVEKLKVEGFSKALKPETLQTMYAVIGSPALQFEFVGGAFSWTEGKGGAVTIPKQVIRQRVAGTTLEPNPKTIETTIPSLTYTLKPDEQQAHIYVELKPTPRYVVSTKPLQITPDRLLVGLLNGTEGSRDFTPLYGFTEISPSHIATRYIRSRSGNMLIDLETGNIYSDKIEFRRPDGSTKDIDQVISEEVQVGGRNLIKKGDAGYWSGEYKASQGGAFIYTTNVLAECIYQVEIRAISEECVGAKVYWQWSSRRQGKPVELTKEWQRLVSPIVPNASAIGLSYAGPSGTVELRNIKAERGTVATDWSPAPEDVQADIEAVERGYQKLIERVDVEFAISNSRDTAPTSGWVTNAPTPSRGQALWQRTKVYLKDGTKEVRGVTCIQGKDGLDGKDGAKGGDGADGRGITKIVELYYLSSSNTALGNGAWSETAPTPKEGFWIWTKTRIHYTTGEHIETQPICVTGNKGDKGDRGERGLQGLQGKDGTNGLPGRDGVDGKTSYTHIAYADTVTGGGFSQSPAGKAYIGMYVDFVQTDSTNPKKYAWSLIKGADGKNGLNGKDGVPGKPGADGRTPYLHIAYANSQDGKQGFSVSVSEGKSYIGTYTDYTQADSTDPTKYSWSKIKGEDAVVSREVTIDATGLDENTYYPIAITNAPHKVQNRYRVHTELYLSGTPSWATHSRGFQCELMWKCYNSNWGATDVNMQVEVASYRFVNDVPPISQPSQITQNSTNYTYVRGGGKYYVELQAREQATLDKMTAELVTSKKDFGYGYFLEPQTSITAPITDLDKEAKAREKAVQEINSGLTNANTLISTLDKAQKQLEQGVLTKADTKDIQYLLDSLKNGKTQVAGGLVLTNNIILSDPNSKDVTAMISGSQMEGAKAIRLGIAKDGTEATAFNNNGLGHIGELFFNGDYIGFGDALNSYMQVGGTARTESDMVNASTETRSVNVGSAEREESGTTIIQSIRTMAGFRDIKFSVDLKVMAVAEAVRRDGGVEYESPQDPGDQTGGSTGSGERKEKIPYYDRATASTKAYIEVVHTRGESTIKTLTSEALSVTATAIGGTQVEVDKDRGRLRTRKDAIKKVEFAIPADNVRLNDIFYVNLVAECEHFAPNGTAGRNYQTTATAKDLIATTQFDTSKPEVRITQDKTSFFYGRTKYMLLNYDNLIAKIVGDVLMKGNLNVKGTITADSYQGNGMPLAGATFDSSGSEVRALGRYKNKSNSSFASAYYDYSTKSFTVYHSIPHSRYIPLVNAFNDPASPVVSDVSAYSFKVRFTLQSERYNGWAVGFSYIAFQAE